MNFNLPGLGIAHGLLEIIQHVDLYSNVTSQHALITNYIQLLSEKTANANTELTVTFFGGGKQVGEIYVVYRTIHIPNEF
ncbi:hypothetical protein N0V90_005326 [Kalmusia sp. IMI 367209]|nr:hypothetical protein N0V90_005326 [Kalmusia sp. IMI 367209]